MPGSAKCYIRSVASLGPRHSRSGLPRWRCNVHADAAARRCRLRVSLTIQRLVPSTLRYIAQRRLEIAVIRGAPILARIRCIRKLRSTNASGVTRSTNVIGAGNLSSRRSLEISIATRRALAENRIPELHVRRIPIGFASSEAYVHDLRNDRIAVDHIRGRDADTVDSSVIIVRADHQINACALCHAARAHHVECRLQLVARRFTARPRRLSRILSVWRRKDRLMSERDAG